MQIGDSKCNNNKEKTRKQGRENGKELEERSPTAKDQK